MSDTQNTVSVTIMDKHYKIKCPPEHIAELRESAQLLDSKMRELTSGSRGNPLDRTAVIAALNIAHDLLAQQKRSNQFIEVMSRRIQELQGKIDTLLNEQHRQMIG